MDPIVRAPAVSSEPLRLQRVRQSSELTRNPSQQRERQPAAHPLPASGGSVEVAAAERSESQSIIAPQFSEQELQLRYEAELTHLRQQAESRGFSAGIEKAELRAKQVLDEQVDRLTTIMAGLQETQDRVFQHAEDAAVEVVFTAVCKIIGDAAARPDAIIGIVHRVVAACRERDQLVVRLHPQDLELVQHHLIESPTHPLSLRADSMIQYGGCIVDAPNGSLDGQLDSQLQALRDTLLAVRKSRGTHGNSI